MQNPKFETLRKIEFEHTLCPVCESVDATPKHVKKILDYVVRYSQCNVCNALYMNPRVTEKSLKNIYACENFFEGKEDNINYYSFLEGEPYLSRTAKSRLRRIMKHAKGKNLLEVASAAGFFLNQAKLHGFDVQGIEFSGPMAQWSSSRWGIPVTPDSIDRVDLPAN